MATVKKKQNRFAMKELAVAQESDFDNIKRIKKSGNQKEVSVIFHKTEKVEEPHLRSNEEEKKAVFTGKTEAGRFGKNGGSLADVFSSATDLKKNIKSSDFSRRPFSVEKIKQERRKQKNLCDFCCCNCCSWRESRPKCSSLQNLDSRSWNGCDFYAFEEGQSESWNSLCYSSRPRRKCKSNPNFSKASSKKLLDGEREFQKVKRSLKLLGFELSDFGIHSGWEENLPKKKLEEKSASFTTKITHRSISLDSLRASVKRAWLNDRLDESHRRLLAQAAYEEWYFKKERELWMKRNEERLTRLKAKENLRDHFERKKEQSEEEFRKWLRNKTTKRKGNEKTLTRNQKNPFDKLMKTKEESEMAFAKWKKTKEEELEKKKKEKKKEEERRLKSEKEKNEKKLIAEKAFQQWKTKLKEAQTAKEAKRRRNEEIKRREVQERKKRDEGSQITFEMWKALKDEQIKEKTKKNREAYKIATEERLTQMEERMYEAEQAFEDWLEKVESRKQKQFSGMNVYSNTLPWIPA